jgi:GDP-L-fucose synthase
MPELVSRSSRIFLAGHTGLVGGSIYRTLQAQGFEHVIVRDFTELDLTDAVATRRFFDAERPDAVIDAAAKVGGIMANWTQPWEFVEQNLLIELNLIGEAFRHGVQRLVFLGSSCIYPREAPQPLREEYLLTGPLEETNRSYAMAKIAGIEMCRSLNRQYGTDYLSLMPTNLYGPGDNFDRDSSHVLPAMIRKFHDAKVAREGGGAAAPPGSGASAADVTLWGTGAPRREFLHVEDVGRAITFCLQNVHAADVPDGLLNVGCGEDLTVRELAALVQRVVGYDGRVEWDASKPDGTPRKLMDVTRIMSLGWAPSVALEDGIRRTYGWYLKNRA